MHNLYVWDLHGTIEKGNENAVIEISNQALQECGYDQRFTEDAAHRLYGLKWYQYFEDIMPNMSHDDHLKLQHRCFQISDERPELLARYMKPTPHVEEVLGAIQNSPHEQILISNTIPTTIPLFLNALGLASFFDNDHRFSVNAHSKEVARKKEHVLEEYLFGKKFKNIYVIGDSGTDIAMAKHVGATSILFTHPDFPTRQLEADLRTTDLRTIIKTL